MLLIYGEEYIYGKKFGFYLKIYYICIWNNNANIFFMGLTEEKINKNYLLWIEQLKKYGCYSEKLIEEYGEKIKLASFAMNEVSGGAYQGSLLDIVLYELCVIANHINENAFGMNDKGRLKHEDIYVSKESMLKVLLLQHISKCELFVPTSEQWKINKGMFYEFNPSLTASLKMGERSLYICSKCGIQFTEEEWEAMKILDKEKDETFAFTTPLSQIVKTANQFTTITIFKKKNKN